jgi:hypothetical protein
MALNFQRHCEPDHSYVIIYFDKNPLVVIFCDRFVLMSDLLREYAEWGGFDLSRLSYTHMGQVILEVH